MTPETPASTNPPSATNGTGDGDPRAAAFCSPLYPGLFHSVAYSTGIWRQDPFDVSSIHGDVREAFDRMVDQVSEPAGLPTGRMLLLLGDSGSGKTHLM